MGSGLLAAPILSRLTKEHHVIAVLTSAAINHKSTNAKTNPVMRIAREYNIPVRHVDHKFTTEDINYLSELAADIVVVASYGIILPNAVLELGRFPPLNVHPSALPCWRGAAPIERAIEYGAQEISVAIIEMIPALDAGDIFTQDRFPVSFDLSMEYIYHQCAAIGAKMLLATMAALEQGNATRQPQSTPSAEMAYAKKISKKELLLNFSLDAVSLHRKIWAFSLAGGCYFIRNGERIKILETTHMIELDANQTKQIIGHLDLQTGTIAVSNGYIIPRTVQREGKKPLPAAEVWRGLKSM